MFGKIAESLIVLTWIFTGFFAAVSLGVSLHLTLRFIRSKKINVWFIAVDRRKALSDSLKIKVDCLKNFLCRVYSIAKNKGPSKPPLETSSSSSSLGPLKSDA